VESGCLISLMMPSKPLRELLLPLRSPLLLKQSGGAMIPLRPCLSTHPFTFPSPAMTTQLAKTKRLQPPSAAQPVDAKPKTRKRAASASRASAATSTQVPASSGKSRVPSRRSARRFLAASSPLIKRSLLVGSSLLAGALLILTGNLINPGSLLGAKDPNAECQGKVQSQSVISRQQLSQLLTVAERDRKTKVRDIVKAPYCTLPTVEVRAGVKAEREAYPLAFDPKTRLVILYEGDEYAGYAFDVRR
jgi:hypothetical protein